MLNMTPWEKYQQDLRAPGFVHDEAQANAVRELQRLYEELIEAQRAVSFWRRWLPALGGGSTSNEVLGLYFWGGVGRGKTYLVDTFYDCLPFERKMRVHFHRFMYRIHDELKAMAGESDPLPRIARKLADEAAVICFDEFFVSDITDAMILGTLMEALFAEGIVLVATSNIEPKNLYKNGLQRARFLPAIQLLEAHTRVVNVDSGVDYRLRTLEQAEIYHSPLDKAAQQNLDSYFVQLAPESLHAAPEIEINHRVLKAMKNADGVVMFDFATLCEGPRSQADYIELSRCYHTVLLAAVPAMGAGNDDAARRFIAMVDEFYERNVKLIIAAAVPMQALYSSGSLNFEFKRCLSRLQEMQSHDYLAREHLP